MRILTRKLWRAFPELDRYSDEQCRRFVRAASGSVLRRLARTCVAFVASAIPCTVVIAGLTIRSVVRRNAGLPAGSWSDLGWFTAALILSILAAPALAYIVRDVLLRRRVRTILRDRSTCVSCRYVLIGVPVPQGNTVICPECATPCEVDPSLQELALDAAGQRVFAPTTTPSRTFLTPAFRRKAVKCLKIGALAAVIIVPLSAGLYEFSLHRQAARAKAAMLAPNALTLLAESRQPPALSDSEPDGWKLLIQAIEAQDAIDVRVWRNTARGTPPDFSLIGAKLAEGRSEEQAATDAQSMELARQLVDIYKQDGIYILLDQMASTRRAVRDTPFSSGGPSTGTFGRARNFTRMNGARMFIAREREDLPEYTAALRSTLAIADAFYRQPLLIDALVAVAIEANAHSKLRLLLTGSPSAEWLDAVEAELRRYPSDRDASLSFEGEGMFMEHEIAKTFSNPAQVRFGIFSAHFRIPGSPLTNVDLSKRVGSLEDNLAAMRDLTADSVARAELPRYQRPAPAIDPTESRLIMLQITTMPPERTLQSFDQVALDRAATAAMIALERYRLANGKYPASLAELGPLPLDPWSGRPLGYRLLNPSTDPHRRGYLLYSAGSDQTDNGGTEPGSTSKVSRWDILKDPPVTGTRGLDFVLNSFDW